MTEPERLVGEVVKADVGTFEAFYRSTRGGSLAVVLALRGPRRTPSKNALLYRSFSMAA